MQGLQRKVLCLGSISNTRPFFFAKGSVKNKVILKLQNLLAKTLQKILYM